MDYHIPGQTPIMNIRSRKSAETEYSNIQKRAKENPQEPRHLRSHSRNNDPHENIEDAFIAPKRLSRKKNMKQMITNIYVVIQQKADSKKG